MSIFKSFIAILCGTLLIIVLSIATDQLLETTGVFPPQAEIMLYPWMLGLAFTYRSLYAVAGSYLTARMAPNRPMVHVLILGVIGTLASIGGIIKTIQMDMGGLWYPIALTVTTLPLCWLGGKITTK